LETKLVHVELYPQDGTVYDVTDYWIVGGKLNFTTVNSDIGNELST